MQNTSDATKMATANHIVKRSLESLVSYNGQVNENNAWNRPNQENSFDKSSTDNEDDECCFDEGYARMGESVDRCFKQEINQSSLMNNS